MNEGRGILLTTHFARIFGKRYEVIVPMGRGL